MSRARVDVEVVQLGLLGRHVLRRADDCRRSRCRASARSAAGPVALATPKSITFGTGLSSYSATRTFDGLMSRWMMPFLVRVLDRLADRDEQFEPLARRELAARRSTR